jgi:hypothetical protein
MYRNILIFSALLASGCGISEEQAEQAWLATAAVLAEGQAALSGYTRAGQNGEMDNTREDWTCDEGGVATFDGQFSVEEFIMTVSFDGCVTQGIKMRGDLEFSGGLETEGNTAEYTYDYLGDLEYTGEVEGDCHIDLGGATGGGYDESSVSASTSFSGEACGHEMSFEKGFSVSI